MKDPDKAASVGTSLPLPNSFKFNSSIIFISNYAREKFDSAIVSRSVFVNVRLSNDGKIQRLKYVVGHVNVDIPVEERFELIDMLAKNNLKDLTVRSILLACSAKKQAETDRDIPNWKRLVTKYM